MRLLGTLIKRQNEDVSTFVIGTKVAANQYRQSDLGIIPQI
jgi:hypothetical protein